MMAYVGYRTESPSERNMAIQRAHRERGREHFLDFLMRYKYFCWALIKVW